MLHVAGARSWAVAWTSTFWRFVGLQQMTSDTPTAVEQGGREGPPAASYKAASRL
jgi:hypothetical protein